MRQKCHTDSEFKDRRLLCAILSLKKNDFVKKILIEKKIISLFSGTLFPVKGNTTNIPLINLRAVNTISICQVTIFSKNVISKIVGKTNQYRFQQKLIKTIFCTICNIFNFIDMFSDVTFYVMTGITLWKLN